MAMTSSLLGGGLGLVLVEFEYEYQGRDGALVSIKPNERYVLLAKTNDHWWHVRRDQHAKPFYIPAKYVKELPADFPSPLDFTAPLSPEPTSAPTATPVPVPVPVPVPKTSDRPEEPGGSGRIKPGDEVTIRLRPDGATSYRKTENRMSTFGVPLEFYDPSPLVTPVQRRPNIPGGAPLDSETETNRHDDSGLSRKRPSLSGSLFGSSGKPLPQDDQKDSGKARVPSFSPADPHTVPRPHAQPIPVETPVVPVIPAATPPTDLSTASGSTAQQGAEPKEQEEEEEEVAEEESSVEEVAEEEKKGGGASSQEEDSNHIYESIQDLNLDVDSLTGRGAANHSAPPEPSPAPPPTQDHSTVGADSPVYANITNLKKPPVPVLSVSAPSGPAPSSTDPAHSQQGHTPSSSVSSSGCLSPAPPLSPQDGWQVHTDRDTGKVFYFNPVTRETSWSDPRSPPPTLSGDMDQSRGREGLPASPSPLISPASSQGSSVWEQLVDETSGRPYYYNPSTGATSWAVPEPRSPSSPGSGTGPPPLPEEDYPIDEQNDTDAPVFSPHAQRGGLIPRAQLDPGAPPGWTSTDTDSKTHTQEQWVRSEDDKGKPFSHVRDGNRSQWRLPELPPVPGSQPPQRLMGNGVDEEGATLQVRNWRHSMADDRFLPGHRRNVSDSSSGNSPETTHPDRFRLRRNLSNQSTESHQLHCHLLEKAGILNKTKVVDNGKRIRKNWAQSWTVLHGGILTFHKDPKSAPTGNSSKTNQIVPEYTVDLRGASLSWASKDKSSKKNVLELKTRQGCEYLVQYDTESIICDWHKVIQDAIRQLEQEHLSEEEDDEASDKEDKDRRRSASRSAGAAESDQGRVRTKLRKFLQRRPTLQSVKERGYIRDNVFGCHLDTLCHRENTTVPRFVEKCIRAVERRGLDVDGIYRVSGNLAVIQKLRHKADHEEQLDLEDGQWEEIHVITGALKLFLRELPEPLFPFSSFSNFIAAIQLPDYSQRVSFMKDLVRALPLPNHDTMELLFKHLRKVIEHKESNRMSVQSVAIVFGPTLLRPQTESANMTIHMVYQSQIVELILNEFHTVFPQR